MTFDECFELENLVKIHKRCRCGKAHKKEVIGFELNLSQNIVRLSKEIKKGYKVSKYKTFNIYDPKERVIEALPYKDRLVQMALCEGIIAPYLEKRLIVDNVACRKKKGTAFAFKRLNKFLHNYFIKYGNEGYFLKVDIRKYFASINHEILIKKLKACNFDERALDLMCKFISVGKDCEKGIPLGNQTSQWFALLYLDEVDRLIKEKLGIKYYIRYMDDLILIDRDKEKLKQSLLAIRQRCEDKLLLELNAKTQIGKLKDGFDFLGFRFSLCDNGHINKKLKKQAKVRIKKKFKLIKILKENDIIDKQYIDRRLASYRGHLKDLPRVYLKLKTQFNL